jgi:hypothetical protein
MHLTEVINKQSAKEFIQVNVFINKNDPNYIRPLDKDINQVFDPKKNKTFRHGEAIRWILKDDSGNLIGRIAAFTNKKYKNTGDMMPVGGIGFFDCINDQMAADMLFDVAKHWLIQKGMQAMDGPINFGERDRWWGLLTEGFEPPVYCLNYNPPYYKQLFENYGFKNFFNQYCYALKVRDRVQEKFYTRHAKFSGDPTLSVKHLKKNQLKKFAADFVTVYNKAWAGHGALKSLSNEIVLKTFKTMRPVMDEYLLWFTYHNEEPVALWTNIPDLNQWFKYLHGRFDWWSKIKFFWIRKTKPCKKFTGIAFGIIPEWQGTGIESFMIMEAAKIVQHKLKYEDFEMQWIGDFNPKMINIAEGLGTYRSRLLITYRYLFDRTKEFKRHPILN